MCAVLKYAYSQILVECSRLKKITIYDVAKKASVSPKTVSRVINAEQSVSTKTKTLVESAIAALGYSPNTSARSLRTKRSYILAFLYDNLSPAYVMDLQVGILSICDKAEFNMVIRPCNFTSETLAQDIAALIKRSRVDGLILSPPISDHKELIQYLEEKQIDYVRIAPINTKLKSSYVFANDREAAAEMTDHLISLGHTSIGIILGDLSHLAGQERLAGYKNSLKKAELPVNSNYIEQGDFSFESGESAALKLLTQKQPPTAIFACNDYMAAATMKIAHKLGLRVPEDVSIAGFDDAPVSKYLWPTLTTVWQPVQQLASQSADLLINKILNQETSTAPLELRCELVIRESTAAIKK